MKAKTARLSERAMLVHLSGHQWTGRKKDKKVTQNVCVLENAALDAGAWWTYLVPQKELQPINTAWGRVYRRFNDLTLPWLDGGLRILPSDMYMKFRDEIKQPIADYDKAVDVFLKRWPTIVANSPRRLGKLQPGQRLPTVDQLKDKFYIQQDILPVPEMADFRINVGDEEAKDIRSEVASTIKAGTTKATQELWSRLSELVNDVAETMGKRDKKFRDTIITKLKTFCELVPKYNIMDNSELEDIRRDTMDKLAELDPEDLREIPNHRKKASKDAKAILAKIDQYIN
jgi:hypothetical protein